MYRTFIIVIIAFLLLGCASRWKKIEFWTDSTLAACWIQGLEKEEIIFGGAPGEPLSAITVSHGRAFYVGGKGNCVVFKDPMQAVLYNPEKEYFICEGKLYLGISQSPPTTWETMVFDWALAVPQGRSLPEWVEQFAEETRSKSSMNMFLRKGRDIAGPFWARDQGEEFGSEYRLLLVGKACF